MKAAGTDETEAVNAKLKALPVDDVFAHGGIVQPNGRMVHDMYLFEVKKRARVEGPLGPLPAARDHPGQGSLRHRGRERLPLTAK